MSIIQLPVAELRPALAGLGKVINKRVTLPVLGHVKIERTRDGWIALTGTNLDCFATVRLEQPSDGEPDSVLVSYEDLNKTLKVCGKSEVIEIESTGDKALLRYSIGNQSVESRVVVLPAADFPEMPKVVTDPVALPDGLRESIHQAFACASTDETRYVITGVFIDVSKKDCHQVVGTNGRQLYTSNSFTLPLQDSLLIPPSKFLQWKEFNADGSWQLRVAPREKEHPGWIQLSSRRWRYITKQVDGNFPNYRQVLLDPAKFSATLHLEPDSLSNIITMIGHMPCHDLINQTLGVEIKDGNVTLLGRAPKAEQWTRLGIQARVSGADLTIYLNREFFSQALKFGLNTIELIDGISPLRMSNGGRQLVIMPVRVDGPPQTAVTQTPPPIPEAVQEEKSEAEETNNRKEPMNQTTDTPDASPAPDKVEESLELIESLKVSLQDTLTSLKDLGGKLKQIQRDRKTSDKEMQSFRSTIRTLQTLKL